MKSECVKLEPSYVIFPPTFMSNTSSITIKISNNSNQVIRYEWRKNSDLVQDLEELAALDLGNATSRRELERKLLFQSEIFKIEPLYSEIWPHRFQQIVITFSPPVEGTFMSSCYLYDKITRNRFQLQLQGKALPAEAIFNIGSIHVGHVDLWQTFDYQALLMNVSSVDAKYELVEKDRDCLFDVTPREGIVDAGSNVPVLIHFEATKCGQFNEDITFRINGNKDGNPVLNLYGKVIGPSYTISNDSINFQNTGYGFSESQQLIITNTSHIPLDFTMKLKADKNFDKRELQVYPETGVIPGKRSQKFTVEFMPTNLKKYNAIMEFTALDTLEKTEIKVSGECVCPDITLFKSDVELGESFINKRISCNIVANNDSNFMAKYEQIRCIDPTVLDAKLEFDKESGTISPNGKTIIPFYFTPKVIGPIHLTRYIKIAGASFKPLEYRISAYCIGPKIELSVEEIDFNLIPVLNQMSQTFLITNNSTIEAPFTAHLDNNEEEAYSIPVSSFKIPPNETINFQVDAFFKDNVPFECQLELNFDYLSPIIIPIKGRGKGCPIIASIPMGMIEYGVMFKNEENIMKFDLTNNGKRPQQISWAILKPKIISGASNVPSIEIEPKQCTIDCGDSATFSIISKGKACCEFQCSASCFASKNKKQQEIFSPVIHGLFIDPKITFEKSKLVFKYVHDSLSESKTSVEPSKELLLPITIENKITNSTQLSIDLTVDDTEYFYIEPKEFNLLPGESTDFSVTFKTYKKKDFISQKIEEDLLFKIAGNSSVIKLGVTGLYIFPNLQIMSEKEIEFGILSKDTEITKDVLIKNVSQTDCYFSWELLSSYSSQISQIFDVFPISGILRRGASENFHVTFYGKLKDGESLSKYEATAICHAMGGPDYIIQLHGQSAAIEYVATPQKIDFGISLYNEMLISYVNLSNTGPIAIDYSVFIPQQNKFKYFSVDPMNGSIEPNRIQKFRIKIIPGLPCKYKESFSIRIGKFDVEEIELLCDCCFQQLQTNMERHEDDPLMLAWDSRPRKKVGYIPKQIDISPDRLSAIEKEIYEIRLKTAYSPRKEVSTLSNGEKTYNGYVASRFVIDFGVLVIGETKIIEKEIKSVTPIPVSFVIATEFLEGTGFTIEPSSFKDLPPNSKTTLKFKFDTDLKTDQFVGELELPVYLIFDDALCYVIHIFANITEPVLSLSSTCFDFEPTIVGQNRTMTLQIQNMNRISSEFKIRDPAPTNVLKRKKKGDGKKVFKVHPKCGVIPPFSFMNISITFSPKSKRNYSMQMPIETVHNEDVSVVALNGQGYSLNLEFNPPMLEFPPKIPFTDIKMLKFRIINPSEQQIEVYSTQFDSELCEISRQNSVMDSERDLSSNETNEKVQKSIEVNHFSMCIIIHGTPKSGKTYTAKLLSNYLSLPIINLAKIWGNVNENERKNILQEIINLPNFARGFIIDGLDAIPETNETDLFVQYALRVKNVQDELSKNPFLDLQKNDLQTGSIATLKIIMDCLNGHYVFFVGLMGCLSVINKRNDNESIQAAIKAAEIQQEEMERISLMDEEEYNSLSQKEKDSVDAKRRQMRQERIIAEERMLSISRKSRQGSRQQLLGSNQSDSQSSIQTKTKRIDDHDKVQPKKKGRNSNIDENQYKITLFQVTLGTLARIIQEERENAIIIDPRTYKLPNAVKFGVDEESENERCNVTYNNNIILIDVINDNCDISSEMVNFFPRWNVLKENAFRSFIQPPKLTVPEEVEKGIDPSKEFFSLIPIDQHTVEEPLHLNDSMSRSRRRKLNATGNKPAKPAPQHFDPSEYEIKYTPRWIIEPNSSVLVGCKFIGKGVGEYDDVLKFRIVSGSSAVSELPVHAKCVIPDICRKINTLFKTTIKKPKNRAEFVFVESLNEYQFGSQIIMKERTKSTIAAYTTQVTVRNVSAFPVDVTAIITDNNNQPPSLMQSLRDIPQLTESATSLFSYTKSTFSIESQQTITIEPNAVGTFVVGFHPISVEKFRAKCGIFVKDNPEPLIFDLSGEGCVPSVETTVTTLDFDKVLVGKSLELPIDIKNNGKTVAFWKLKGCQQLDSMFTFSAGEGLINPGQTEIVQVKFASKKSAVVKKPIQIDIMDKNKLKIFAQFHIQVIAESFDASFDLQYPRSCDHLKYDITKVGESSSITCFLKNRGRYPANYKLTLARNAAAKHITILPQTEGTISPGEKGSKQINFVFRCTSPVTFNRALCAYLVVTDSITKTRLGRLPIRFSVISDYAKIEIDPPQLDFGLCEVNDTKIKTITIRNTGIFPFDFNIITPEERDSKQRARKQQSLNKKPAKSRSKLSAMHLYFGSFGISMQSGTVLPNSDLNIALEYSPISTTKEEQVIQFHSDNLGPKGNECCIPYVVKAVGSLPEIETENFENIFSETALCLRYDLNKKDKTSFLEDEQVLHFSATILKQYQSVRLFIINTLPIPATVDINIKNKGRGDGQKLPFSVSEKSVSVGPLSKVPIELSFQPEKIGVLSAIFEAIPRSPSKEQTKPLLFRLEGIGSLPTIAITNTLEKSSYKSHSISIPFGKTLVGQSKEKVIGIKNPGNIPARITISAQATPDFFLTNCEYNVIDINPGRIFDLHVLFEPTKVKKSQFDVSIKVEDNPAADCNISLAGEGFVEEVILEDIPYDDTIVFKDTLIGRSVTKTFFMKNISDSDYYFKWNEIPDFTFTPSIGHLHAKKRKEIKVTFSSEKTIKHIASKVTCNLTEIVFNDPYAPEWDNSMLVAQFVPRSQASVSVPQEPKLKRGRASFLRRKSKLPSGMMHLPPVPPMSLDKSQQSSSSSSKLQNVTEQPPVDSNDLVSVMNVKEEPAYSLPPTTKTKEINLKINAKADNIRYHLEHESISFIPTMMFESRTITCSLTNQSLIRIDYRWCVSNFTAASEYSNNEGDSNPFDIEPAIGCIEAGETTTFRITFKPVDVGNYRSKFICDIPNIDINEGPNITVSGTSKRPICHFNIEKSDYLQRRHPDYIGYDLPANTNVIEIFSKGIGIPAVKTCEVMNTTELPYEVTWRKHPTYAKSKCVKCNPPIAMLSSGKKLRTEFTYTPVSAKTVEVLWEFTIPSLETHAYILIVGRIMPH